MILDARFTARLEDGSAPSAPCRIHLPTLLVLEIADGGEPDRFRGKSILEAYVTLPDGIRVRPSGSYLERCTHWTAPPALTPTGRFQPWSVDLDTFGTGEEGYGRGSLLFYLPPPLFIEYYHTRHEEFMELDIPLASPPSGWDRNINPEVPSLIGFDGLATDEALDAMDDLLAWPDLPAPYVPVLRALRTVIRIERRCGGPLERRELAPLLDYPTASVREYGEAHLDLVGRALDDVGRVRLSAASQL